MIVVDDAEPVSMHSSKFTLVELFKPFEYMWYRFFKIFLVQKNWLKKIVQNLKIPWHFPSFLFLSLYVCICHFSFILCSFSVSKRNLAIWWSKWITLKQKLIQKPCNSHHARMYRLSEVCVRYFGFMHVCVYVFYITSLLQSGDIRRNKVCFSFLCQLHMNTENHVWLYFCQYSYMMGNLMWVLQIKGGCWTKKHNNVSS